MHAIAGWALAGLLLFAGSPASDPHRDEQYGLDLLNLGPATEQATGEDVVIAVLDTGVDENHPDLAGHLLPGIDLVDGDAVADDPHGHGTHVAGIAAAVTDNGVGVAGTAPDARILPVRVLAADGTGHERTIAQGVEWAMTHDADVINLSLGGDGLAERVFANGPLNRAIRNAATRGVVVVVAAGNEATFERAYRPGVPVVVVNAVDPQGDPATFTTFGDRRAVAAPGVAVLSTAPLGPSTIWPEGTTGYERLDGTSQAAPFVSGIAALLVGQGLSVDEVRSVLTESAHNDLDDPRLGAGVVDAGEAVAAAATLRSDDDHPGVVAPADPMVPAGIVPVLVVVVAIGVPAAALGVFRRRHARQ
jgi:subtilisin family serine protease